ncbi:GIY-YIG nuclease family protein, partial [Patescibacteria group bacterium]|nr:GIY-YIG nuclease family protein [Patescibacteria group bacterium]
MKISSRLRPVRRDEGGLGIMAVLRSPTPPLANGGAIPSAIMYFVYILRCKDKKLYIGYSDDLLSRFKEH